MLKTRSQTKMAENADLLTLLTEMKKSMEKGQEEMKDRMEKGQEEMKDRMEKGQEANPGSRPLIEISRKGLHFRESSICRQGRQNGRQVCRQGHACHKSR
ncbi:hypothetical protein AVEN_1558-1 [Araneus ventricosus]|uniref:Uncharacterized protein n=1 Tax=Araneus ventricosus TaxID=182803 RepID=A0A4Y2DT87_ARAVE|nr:hypothetical protein AVEN_1558-1 [Araneus ventricosus]